MWLVNRLYRLIIFSISLHILCFVFLFYSNAFESQWLDFSKSRMMQTIHILEWKQQKNGVVDDSPTVAFIWPRVKKKATNFVHLYGVTSLHHFLKSHSWILIIKALLLLLLFFFFFPFFIYFYLFLISATISIITSHWILIVIIFFKF